MNFQEKYLDCELPKSYHPKIPYYTYVIGFEANQPCIVTISMHGSLLANVNWSTFLECILSTLVVFVVHSTLMHGYNICCFLYIGIRGS